MVPAGAYWLSGTGLARLAGGLGVSSQSSPRSCPGVIDMEGMICACWLEEENDLSCAHEGSCVPVGERGKKELDKCLGTSMFEGLFGS